MFSSRLSALVAILILGLTMAVPEPHRGMIDNDDVRDVGVVYTKPDFAGTKKFIFEVKAEPGCLALFAEISSIMICKTDVACTFYTGSSCVAGPNNYAVHIGCGDVANVTTPQGKYFKYYRCGAADQKVSADIELVAKPHDDSTDEIAMR